jgi:hypothetical protein
MLSDPDTFSDQPPELNDGPATRKPVLASEALREDLAPEEPWVGVSRAWSVFGGLLLIASSTPTALLVLRHEAPLAAALPAAALGALAVFAGLLPLPYRVRALAMLMVCFAALGLTFFGAGPLVPLQRQLGEWWLAHVVTALLLPAALLFRERYRALPRARYLLAVAELLTLAFVGFCAIHIMGQNLWAQVASGVAIVFVVLSWLGFMGAQVPVAGSLLAALLFGAVSVQLAAAVVGEPSSSNAELADRIVAVVGFIAANALGTVGLAQLVAALSWDEARAIDFRRQETERPREAPSSSDDWSS